MDGDELPDTPKDIEPDKGSREEAEKFGAKDLRAASVDSKIMAILGLSYIRQALYWSIQLLVYVVSLIAIIGICIWVWHIVAPHKLRWLCKDDLDTLKTILFSGSLSAIAIRIAKKAAD